MNGGFGAFVIRMAWMSALAVGFCAQAIAQGSAALFDGAGATSAQWSEARPVLRAAMACKEPLVHTDAVRAVFHLTNDAYDGEHRLPAPLGIDGFPTNTMTIVDGWRDTPISYSVHLEAPLVGVVRAKQLLPLDGEPGLYAGHISGGGHLVASAVAPGIVRLTCSWPPPGSPRQ